MNKPTIAILGGGVAGMSAAQELGERGFSVSVYEMKPVPGGKSRSVDVPDSAVGDNRALPGEHGFRFFPRFYKHVTDSMKRIPVEGTTRTVFDNLVDTTQIAMPQYDKPAIMTVAKFPNSMAAFMELIADLEEDYRLTNPHNGEFFAWHVLRFATSCPERRQHEYESIVWWDFIEADGQDAEYKNLFAHGITRSLVAAQAQKASTRTIGAIFLQLQIDIMSEGGSSDRILNAPTHDAWTKHSSAHLERLGVDYHLNAKVKEILVDGTKVTGAVVEEGGVERTVTADYYILAVPVEKADPLLNRVDAAGDRLPSVSDLDPSLRSLTELKEDVRWMNGLQIYLTGDDVPITHGHAIYVDSTYALTTVSQHQFWKDTDLSKMGDGTITGIISVDISEWEVAGLNGKFANQCTKGEIMDEVWAQLKKSLNVEGTEPLRDEHLHSWYLDSDIVFFDEDGIPHRNEEPLLVNNVNTWSLRPRAYTAIPNFFLAADYVQTFTDLATMEGANEAARRATNAILEATGSDAAPCGLWPFVEPAWLEPFKALDAVRYAAGQPHALKDKAKVYGAQGKGLVEKCHNLLEAERTKVAERLRATEQRVTFAATQAVAAVTGFAVAEVHKARVALTAVEGAAATQGAQLLDEAKHLLGEGVS